MRGRSCPGCPESGRDKKRTGAIPAWASANEVKMRGVVCLHEISVRRRQKPTTHPSRQLVIHTDLAEPRLLRLSREFREFNVRSS